MNGSVLPIEYIGHLAYTLGILSFLLKEMLWLRAITILSATLCIVFNYFAASEPMWVPIYWNAALAGVNIFQIAVLLLERQEVFLNEKEKWLHSHVFSNFTPGEFRRLLKAAESRSPQNGKTLIIEGDEDGDLLLIIRGTCSVDLSEDFKAPLNIGDFVGEMGLLTGKAASATVIAQEDVEYLAWKRSTLQRLLNRTPSLQAAMRHTLSYHLTEKITRMSQHVS